jgi:hypothetical protein
MLGKADRGCAKIMKLRFDPIRSPLADYKEPLRQRLLEIFMEHAAGALYRDKRSWREFDPSTND